MSDLGTIAWALRTGGTITPADEAEMAAHIPYVLEQLELPPATIDVDLADLAPPDSALTRDANELWREAAPAWLHGHGPRTWCYAAALNHVWQLHADPELLYCATLLHDLGLTPTYGPTEQHPCFAVSGAHAARPVVSAHRPPSDADAVFEAIAMHLNLRIDHDGPLQKLVAAGTLADVTGLRLQLFPAPLVATIGARYPRRDFGHRVGNALSHCATAYPATRCGWLERTLSVSNLTRQHPLDHP